jgi:GT2 family glycosyltransferase
VGVLATARVFTLVLNYRHTDDTLRCVASVRRSTFRDQRLIVIDNDATQETTAALEAGLPATTILAVRENLGYAGGNNVGIRRALERDADFVWLLNPDVIVEPDTLERLMATAQARPDAGIVGSRGLYHRRRPPPRWFNGGVIDWARGGATSHRDDGLADAVVPAEGPFSVDYATGAAMLVRREVFEDVGLLPESWFLYFEETEFNVLARRAGWEVLLEPRSRVSHDKRSTGRLPAPYYVYYFVRNRLRFGATYSDLALDEVDADLERWVEAWRRKVSDREPGWLPTYERLVAAARADARAGVQGRRDDLDALVRGAEATTP